MECGEVSPLLPHVTQVFRMTASPPSSAPGFQVYPGDQHPGSRYKKAELFDGSGLEVAHTASAHVSWARTQFHGPVHCKGG